MVCLSSGLGVDVLTKSHENGLCSYKVTNLTG
jgi:hypothetical protein